MAATRAVTRLALRALALSLAVALGAYLFAVATGARATHDAPRPRPDRAHTRQAYH